MAVKKGYKIHRKKIKELFSNLISVSITLLLVYFLIQNLIDLKDGDKSPEKIIIIVVLSLLLFFLALCTSFNTRGAPKKKNIKPYKSPFYESRSIQRERELKKKTI